MKPLPPLLPAATGSSLSLSPRFPRHSASQLTHVFFSAAMTAVAVSVKMDKETSAEAGATGEAEVHTLSCLRGASPTFPSYSGFRRHHPRRH